MGSSKAIAILVAGVCAAGSAHAAQNVSYVYDALGRLTEVQILSGPGSGVTEAYQYDAAGNRLNYSVTAPGQSAVTLTVTNPRVNISSAGGTLSVNVAGSSPGGTVTFTANGVFLGSAPVINGEASITVEGLATGLHSITATYSGDGVNAPQVATFNVRIQDLRWLPAVLELLMRESPQP
ncbi:Ig-like domain repeat protein [Steroidobacter cummioxidans]|uniref:Ig-like domain repeat protein n=1 Tax=Steroidobacter cummioxidans TaxID=1803913 RepID=UPI001379CEA6|nr:Ig-like domain repeat protein [Steroidobacter cummioxidans]